MEKLYVIIPAYNEGMNIEQCIDDWYPIVERHNGNGESRLVIINDGSKDNTYEIMQKLAKDKPLFTPLTKANGGHGDTVLYGYRYAIRHDADYIFQTDSDGQTLASEFQGFWEQRNEKKVLIGYRNHREDGISRIFVTKVLKMGLFLIFGIRVTDANTPYRLMPKKLLQKYIVKVPENFNLSNVMLTVLFLRGKENVQFIPITFRPRQGGVNSINLKKITKIGIQAVKDFYHLKKAM